MVKNSLDCFSIFLHLNSLTNLILVLVICVLSNGQFSKAKHAPYQFSSFFVLCFGLFLAFVTHWCRLQWRRLPNAEEAEGCLNVTHRAELAIAHCCDEMRCCLTWWRLVIHARTTPNDYREAIAFEMLFVDAKKNKILEETYSASVSLAVAWNSVCVALVDVWRRWPVAYTQHYT